jgi:hypothetical protein
VSCIIHEVHLLVVLELVLLWIVLAVGMVGVDGRSGSIYIVITSNPAL